MKSAKFHNWAYPQRTCGNALQQPVSLRSRETRRTGGCCWTCRRSLRLGMVRRSVWRVRSAICTPPRCLSSRCSPAWSRWRDSRFCWARSSRGVIEPAWGIGAADERVNVWFARIGLRRGRIVGARFYLAGGVVLPIVVASFAIVCLVFRKWLLAAFFVFVLGVESGSYRATTLVIHSHRPRVVRLESLPVNASYPSGHTAASVAVYGGLAYLLTSRVTNRVVPHNRLGVRVIDGGVRRDLADVPRNAPSARRRRRHRRRRGSRGVLVFACRTGPLRPRPHETGRAAVKVAVIAHSGKSLGGGLPELRRALAAEGIDESVLVRGAKEPGSARAGAPSNQEGRGACLRLGRRRDGATLRRCVRGHEGQSRDPPGGDSEPLRDQPGDPARTSRGGRDRPPRRAVVSSTSVVSTGSGSRSWRGPASTRP